MSDKPDVMVRLDDRIRLMSAALAATDFPEKSQQRKPHGTHAHARSTRKYVAEQASHPAIQTLQNLLDQGAPLEALFTLVMYLKWPELEMDNLPRWVPAGWNKQLRDFYEKAKLAEWWEKEKVVWEKCVTESKHVFEKVRFKDFLKPFVGEIGEDFVFVPNIGYPTDQEIGIRLGKELLCLAPPPLAWGDSPPWPYDEDTMITHSYRAALTQYGRLLLMAYLRAHPQKVAEAQKTELPVGDQFQALHPTWEEQFISLFVAAAVAMYLEDYVNEAEAKAYVLMERKARGMTILPGTVSVLRRYLQEQGNKYQSLLDFLPLFPKQLRIAKKIVTL
jgi:hypothetical protein